MRTKALLLTAALGLAGAATSMAQAVYSVNVVGYINLTMKPGFNLVANQLNASPNNKLDTVLPAAALASELLKFSNNNFTSAISDGANWIDPATGDPSPLTVSPGEGFFFFNPDATDAMVTLVGEVKTGSSTVTLIPGFNMISTVVPQDLSLTAANGFPQVLAAEFLTFNASSQTYNPGLIHDGSQWIDAATGDPVDAKPGVGQAFFYFNPETTVSWTRSFNPNN